MLTKNDITEQATAIATEIDNLPSNEALLKEFIETKFLAEVYAQAVKQLQARAAIAVAELNIKQFDGVSLTLRQGKDSFIVDQETPDYTHARQMKELAEAILADALKEATEQIELECKPNIEAKDKFLRAQESILLQAGFAHFETPAKTISVTFK